MDASQSPNALTNETPAPVKSHECGLSGEVRSLMFATENEWGNVSFDFSFLGYFMLLTVTVSKGKIDFHELHRA